MNARQGLRRTNEEFHKLKFELKKKYNNKTIDRNSEYFEFFDEDIPKIMNCTQNYFIDIAAKVALNSTMNHKHGAIIVYKKQIISSGYNYIFGTFSIHAEVAAISNVKGKYKELLQESELYVVRIGPDKYHNPLKYSKPCFNCQHFISKNLIKKTYYSTNYDYDDIVLKAK